MGLPFLSRASGNLTLLFVTPHRLVRADFTGGNSPSLVQLWQAPAPPDELLPMLAEAALLLGPVTPTRAYVITSTVLTQFLSVPTAKVGGLEGDELTQALGFEAEAVSGLNPFESVLGALPQGDANGERQFWITQVAKGELDQTSDALFRHKAELAGVLHAGGLPRHLESGAAGEPWQRLEVWNDTVFCLDTSASGTSRVHLIATHGNRSNWLPEADAWFAGCGPSQHRETLAADPAWLASLGGGQSLEDEPVLRTYLGAWARELLLNRVRVPLLRPAPRPMAASTRWAIGGGLTAAALVACTGHWLFTQAKIRGLEAELKAAQRPAAQLQALVAEATELGRQLTSVTDQSRNLKGLLEDWKDGVTREHRRHAVLLEGLVHHTPANLMIESISEKPGELRISGISMTPESPGFANGLAASMEPFQWTIDPPRRRALNLAPDGGPWALQWLLRPNGRPDTNAPAPAGATAANAPR